MLKLASRSTLLLLVLLPIGALLHGQAPTGTILGTITDESGAVIPGAKVTIGNKATGVSREAITNAEGLYSAAALEAGDYQVRVEVAGFRTLLRDATVQTGTDTTVNAAMSLGEAKELVTVEAATAQINYETHNIQGVIQHEIIQDMPLNGRSFLQLAVIEPGVTIAAGSTAQFNALFTVSVLGGGNRTAITLDGGNVSDNVTVAAGMTSMNFPQDMIQEFQLSTVNFDLATPISVGGAINVVTRSGSNDFHGSGYFYFRDHNMAAYPNLKRLAGVPSSPFFARRNPGFWVGGPIKKDRLFFFFNYEYMNQVQAISIQTTAPSLQALQGTYGSPYLGKQFSLRLDYHINSKETLFIRHSHDGNSGRGQSLLSADPGSWTDNFNWADQSIIGITSALTTSLVNDFRGQYNYWNNKNYQAVASDCSLPCVAGSGLPTVYTLIGTNLPAVGPNFNAPQGRNTRRYEIADNLSWQHGAHRFKFGTDFNLTKTAGVWGFCLPMCVGAWSEEFLKNTFGSALAAKIAPDATGPLSNDADVLNLPVYNTTASIFSGVGVGAISTPAGYSYDDNRWGNQYRVYAQDVWKIRPNFTFNYGFAWNAQTGYFNVDIPNNPQYLAPILGSDLKNPSNNTTEFEPALGFAWSPFKDNKTVIRGGAGIYWDTIPWYWKLRSEPSIGPPGNGRSTLAASAFTNIYPGITNFLTGKTLPVGANLELGALYNMSIKQFMALVNQELPAIQAQLAPSTSQRSGPFSLTGIDIAKQGVELFTSHFPMARSYQTSIGIQHDLGHGMVVTADWARRQGENAIQGEVDRNLTNRYLGSSVARPVIPFCAPIQLYVPGQECSAGSITFWTAQGRQVYDGLLVKVNKRLSNRFSFVASYAFQKNLAQPSVVDDLNYARSYGETLAHHDLNVNGIVDLPWGFTLSINSAIISRMPTTANVASLFLPGTVPQTSSSFPLPGLPYGGLNAGTSKADLQKAVDAFNTTYAGTKDARGGIIPALALPPDYQFGDPFFDQDARLTKVFSYKERYKLTILAEMFNVFNIANLTNYGFTLDSKASDPTKQTYAFGQPTQRIIQTFGPGGPRAVQVAARITF